LGSLAVQEHQLEFSNFDHLPDCHFRFVFVVKGEVMLTVHTLLQSHCLQVRTCASGFISCWQPVCSYMAQLVFSYIAAFVKPTFFQHHSLPAPVKVFFFQSTWVNLLSVSGEHLEGCII
jgi:hypothetical protein